MTDQDPDERRKELIDQTRARHEEAQEEIQEFHEAISEESDAEVLETQYNIAGDIVIDVSAKQNGELMDRMGAVEQKLEKVEQEESGVYRVTEAAEEAAQILADVTDNPEYTKDVFYEVYRTEGLEELGKKLRGAFEAIQNEGERLKGAADGFRKDP